MINKQTIKDNWLLLLVIAVMLFMFFIAFRKSKVVTQQAGTIDLYELEIKNSTHRQDSLIKIIDSLVLVKEKIIIKKQIITREYEKAISDYNILDTTQRIRFLTDWLRTDSLSKAN